MKVSFCLKQVLLISQWNTPNKPVNYLWAMESAFWICERGQNLAVDWAVELAVAVKQPVAERPSEHCWCSSAATPLLIINSTTSAWSYSNGCEQINRQTLLASNVSCCLDKKNVFSQEDRGAFILWGYLRS